MTSQLLHTHILIRVLLLLFLATRLTLLVVDDRITAGPRRWLQSRLKPTGYLMYLTWCPWCVSVHASWLTLVAYLLWSGPTLLVAAVALWAFCAGLIVELTARPTPPKPPPHA